ncbi:ribbon-helix-helix protein, CopG family [Streptomyces sp. SDT5-1]|uniref:ribbon-helix-helix protein, CopG family n=1 Tax=Streptomyces sp. SDT5-1 TaxID=3406418 RepID=UPI003FD26886
MARNAPRALGRNLTETLSVKLTEDMKKRLLEISEATDVTAGEIIRKALIAALPELKEGSDG